jgi:hypothetical protein
MASIKNAALPSEYQVQMPLNSTAFALSAGELQAVAQRETRRILQESQRNRLVALKKGLELMRARDLISEREAGLLGQILDHVFAAARGKADVAEAYIRVKQIHHELVLESATPGALAMASIALNAFLEADPSKEQPTVLARQPNTGSTIGGFVGFIVGFYVANPIVGAAVGGAVGGAIGECFGADDAD